MTIALLANHGIELATSTPGRHYTTCPRCSKDRSKAHQGAKVLGITIEPNDSIHWGCNHCGWTGPEKGNGARSTKIEITYDYHDADGTLLFQKVRNPVGSKSRFFCRRPDGRGCWINNTKDITKPIYRWPEIIEAIKAGHPIAVAEGEKDVDALWAIGLAATTNFDGAADITKNPNVKTKWRLEYSEALRGADLIVLNDNDGPGFSHAEAICKMSHGVAARVRRLDLAPHWPEIPKGGDVSDWLAAGGEHTAERLKALIKAAPDYAAVEQQQQPPKPEPEPLKLADMDAEITRLAKLPTLQYEHERKTAAEKLNVRASILDRLIEAERAKLNPGAGKQGQGRAIEFPQPEPWTEAVDGAELLDAIATAIRMHVVLPDSDRDICTLWAMHAYVTKCFLVTPRLAILAPTRGCGKTTLLSVLEHLVPRPLRTSSVTASVTFRVIEMHEPTLLIDEAKNIAEKTDLLEVLNDGHRRGGQTLRNAPVDDGYEPRAFSTFAALAIGLIGALPSELHHRSVVIKMKRCLAGEGEQIEEIRVGENEHLDVLARKAMRWSTDNAVRLADMNPAMPAGIYNREADNWKPLIAIADAIGGEWPKRARAAAVVSHADGRGDEVSRFEHLLADIRSVFAQAGGASVADLFARKADVEISSADLVETLVALEGHPWAEMGRANKPLTQNLLARMLKPLGIAPERRRYKLAPFEEAFARYLPPEGVYNRTSVHNAVNTGTSNISQVYMPDNGCTVAKCEKPNNDGLLYTCTVAIPPEGGESTSPPSNGSAKGLSTRTIQELAAEYADIAHSSYQEVGSSDADYRRPADAWLRKRLGEMGVFREHIEGEFERVMDEVFAV
jgi:putative DNA primase/helicase